MPELGSDTLVNWMNTSLKQPEPDYGIKFEMPTPTTQPAASTSEAAGEWPIIYNSLTQNERCGSLG